MIMNIPCKSMPMPYYVGHGTDYSTLPLTFQSTGNTTVSIDKTGLSCNINKTGWTSYSANSSIILVDKDTVAFSGTNSQISAKFTSTSSTGGTLEVYGNAHSLINWGNMTTQYCFSYLFNANKQLVKADNLVLPALSLTNKCYDHMFQNCSNLVYGPQLPATTLSSFCYEGMFQYCSSLITEFVLPATTIPSYGYHFMFNGCSKLSSLQVKFTSWGNNTSWVQGVASTGTFTCPSSLVTPQNVNKNYGESKVPRYWTVVNK